MTEETELQRLARLEEETVHTVPGPMAEERRRQLTGAARQYSRRDFKPYGRSS